MRSLLAFVAVLSLLVLSSATSSAAPAPPRGEDGPLGPSTGSYVRCVDEDTATGRVLTAPRSVGSCQDGYLYESVALPEAGAGYAVIPSFRERHLNFGTPELVGLAQRAGARVAQELPGAVLRVGNLSGRHGGPIRYSRSHQSGRDVDFAFYAVDAEGRPAQPKGMPRYRCSGRGRDGAVGLRFDTARNWALVAALLTDEEAEVEVIFVAPCLKRRLLQHAAERKAERGLRERAATLLREAGDRSYDHDDHFHVRIFCSAEDLSLGCRNDPRAWPWTRVHESTRLEDGKRLRRALHRGTPMDRVATLQHITDFDLKALGPAVVRLVDDEDASVAKMAATTTRRLAAPGALAWLRRRARAARQMDRLLRYLEIMAAFEAPAPATARFLERMVGDPAAALRVPLRGDDEARVLTRAIRALSFLGRRASIAPLVRRLSHDSPEVRAEAERALAFLTNHEERFAEQTSPKERRRQWWGWWEEARRRRWDRVVREGFLRAGVELPRALYRWTAVRPLYRSIAQGGYLSWNAQRLLRGFARDNAPRIPHERPELAQPLWRAWILSRLPTGAEL